MISRIAMSFRAINNLNVSSIRERGVFESTIKKFFCCNASLLPIPANNKPVTVFYKESHMHIYAVNITYLISDNINQTSICRTALQAS